MSIEVVCFFPNIRENDLIEGKSYLVLPLTNYVFVSFSLVICEYVYNRYGVSVLLLSPYFDDVLNLEYDDLYFITNENEKVISYITGIPIMKIQKVEVNHIDYLFSDLVNKQDFELV